MFCLAEPILQHRLDLNSCQTSNMIPSSLLTNNDEITRPGLERDGEWSAAVEKQRKQAKPKSNGSTRDPGSTYLCLEPECTLTFDSIQDAEDHMDTGEHVFTPENEKIYDMVKRQWAVVSTTVKGKNEKIGEAAYGEGQGSGASKGWALKKQKAAVRISPAVKSYLTCVFNEGTRQDKAKPAVIAEEIKRNFSRVEWLETQTIKGFFSRLAAEQKSQEVEEEYFDTDGQESRALEREALLQELVDETQREIDLQHPITFKNFNLCLLLSNKRLSDALKKLKLCDLREMQEGLNVEINGPSSRKATYIEPLVNLVKCCSCCH